MRKQTRGQRGFKSVGARGAVGRPRPSLSPRHCARRPQPRSPSDPPLARTGHAPPATEHTSPPAAPRLPLSFGLLQLWMLKLFVYYFKKKNKKKMSVKRSSLDSLEQKSADLLPSHTPGVNTGRGGDAPEETACAAMHAIDCG